tara:strand:+ start:611 stop:784 length:174 start_codon:yes stop_codon:yes gene_type:complete
MIPELFPVPDHHREEALQTTSIPWGSIVYTVDPLLFGHLVGIEATAIHQKPDLNALS